MHETYTHPEILFSVAALILDLMLMFFLLAKPAEFRQTKNFRLLVYVITASAFMDIWRGLVVDLEFSPAVHYMRIAVCSVSMILEEAIPFLDEVYLDSYVNLPDRNRKSLNIVHHVLFYLFSVLMLLNIRFEWIVGYDETFIEWYNGPLYLICALLPVYFGVFIAISVLRDLRYMKRYVYITMSYAVFLPYLFLVLQILGLVPSALVTVGISIGIYIWYFAVENADHRTLTESRKALEEARKLASDANKAKSIFLANMSHEIRTPMNAVLGLDEMILHTDNLDEVRKYATTIKSSGKTLLDIISDILDFSKLESGKMELNEEEYHFGKLVEHACSKGRILSEESGIAFVSEVDPDIPDLLYGAKDHLLRIMETVIEVGFKNTKKGSVTLSIHSKPDAVDGGEDTVCLWMQVRDTGMGLPERALSEAFDSFEKLEEDSLNEVEGTGLKLAVAKHLADLMNASISIDSIEGEGSTVTLVLCQKQRGKATIGERQEAAKVSSRPKIEHSMYCAPDAKVLVVDDNSINLIVAQGLLKQTQAQINTCESGTACLEMLKKTRYDVVFLDMLMPDMDGVETLQKAMTLPGSLNRYTPFIALTANSGAGVKERCLRDGFSDYVSKPIDASVLYEVFFRNISQDLVHEIQDQGVDGNA